MCNISHVLSASQLLGLFFMLNSRVDIRRGVSNKLTKKLRFVNVMIFNANSGPNQYLGKVPLHPARAVPVAHTCISDNPANFKYLFKIETVQ